MTTHQIHNEASSLGFQVLFLCLRVVTVVFIFLGKEVGGKRGFYHTVVVQNKVHLLQLVHFIACYSTLSCDQLINNEAISSSWSMEAPCLISQQLTKGV